MKLYGLEFLRNSPEPKPTHPQNWGWEPAHPEWFVSDMPFALHGPSEVFGHAPYTLLIGNGSAEIGALTEGLREQKKAFVRVDWDEFSESSRWSLKLSSRGLVGQIHVAEKTISLNKIHSVYYEPPTSLITLERQPEIFSKVEKIFLNRWRSLVLDLHAFLPNAKWIPGYPQSILDDSQRKLAEVQIANECGFHVPETQLTQDPKEATKFLKKHKGKVLFRDLANRLVFQGDNSQTYRTELVDPKSEHWDNIIETPTVFQKYIDKKSDVRAVYVDGKILACEIDSQKNKFSKLDWREYDYANVKYRPIQLDAKTKASIRKFNKKVGLKMGSYDFAVSKSGKLYFLEMNRPGAWLFIEGLSGIPIRKALVKSL